MIVQNYDTIVYKGQETTKEKISNKLILTHKQ